MSPDRDTFIILVPLDLVPLQREAGEVMTLRIGWLSKSLLWKCRIMNKTQGAAAPGRTVWARPQGEGLETAR